MLSAESKKLIIYLLETFHSQRGERLHAFPIEYLTNLILTITRAIWKNANFPLQELQLTPPLPDHISGARRVDTDTSDP